MQKIQDIKNNLQLINIFDRHTLEKFMLNKKVTVFDDKENIIDKVNIVEHLIPVEKELEEAVKNKGVLYLFAFDSFNGSSNAKNIRIINYFDFIEQSNNYSQVLIHDFKSVLAIIEKDLEDYVFDNSHDGFSEIKNYLNNELLLQFYDCRDQLAKNIASYRFASLVFRNPITFYIDFDNMKMISVLLSKAIARIIEKHKRYIDKTSIIYKSYEEEYKFILKKEKKYKKGEAKHEDSIEWKDIFKEKSTYKHFIRYANDHIINSFVDYSFLFQNLKNLELIFNHKHLKYIDWLYENNFIKEKEYDEFIENGGFRSLSKSSSEQRENNFNNIFDM